MEYIRIEGQFPKLSDCAVTLGKFDGIHRGHRKLIHEILKYKEETGALAVVLAFVSGKQMILTSEERRNLLDSMGVDILMECPMDESFKHIKADSFIRQILVGSLQSKEIVVGEDFRFGFERKGTPDLLIRSGKKYQFQTKVIAKEMDGSRKISSTFVREELKKGKMEKVTELLGADFFVSGTIKHGKGLGHKDFFPTINLIPPSEKLLPPNGVYATFSDFGEGMIPGITNIGWKPTVGENFIGVETNLFDFDENLYERDCTVFFKSYQRPERKFSSFEALKKQISNDIENGKKILFT